MKKTLLLVFCIVTLCSLLALPLLLHTETPDNLHQTVDKAINYFQESREPYALLWLDVMHRRFGISSFADSLDRYDQELAKRPEQAPLMRVFSRIADYDN